MADIDPRLIQVALTELPVLVGYLKGAFIKNHPGEPIPTNAEVMAAFENAYSTSLARDEELLKERQQTP